MKSQLVSDTADAQVHVVILDSGEEALAALTKFANDKKLAAASLTAIGAFEKATVGWFDLVSKSYRKIEVGEQSEVLSAVGDVATGDDGKPSLHIHIVLGLSDGSTRGGHLLAGPCGPRSKWCSPKCRQSCGGKRERISESPSSISARTSVPGRAGQNSVSHSR